MSLSDSSMGKRIEGRRLHAMRSAGKRTFNSFYSMRHCIVGGGYRNVSIYSDR